MMEPLPDWASWPAPLDWSAGPFLTLYMGLIAVVLLVIIALRRMIGPFRVPGDQTVGVLEIAYLAGGPRRVADAVLLGLLAASAAEVDKSRRGITVNLDKVPLPRSLEPFRECVADLNTRDQFRKTLKWHMAPVCLPLIQRGLVPGLIAVVMVQLCTALLLAAVFAFGIVKILIGEARQRPVGYLEVLVIGLVLIGGLLLLWPPRRTWAGTSILTRYRKGSLRLIRAPLENELVLAFALAGSTVLVGTAYADVMMPAVSAGGHDSSSCGGGGDGCSGGGDGGGGCGGCGGGGH